MKIPVKNRRDCYLSFDISYLHYSSDGKVTSSTFSKIESFQEFMGECHPDVNTDEFVAKYGKRLSYLTALAEGGDDRTKPSTTLYCFVAGDCIMSAFSYCGIMEKWHDYQDGHRKSNESYIHTFIAHNWQFDKLSTGTFKISYWYDKNENDKAVYKIHQFKDKIIFESPNGVIHSIIVSNDHYVYYAGLKKESK